MGITAFGQGPNQNFGFSDAASAYDCCVICQQSTNCAGVAYLDGACYSILSNTCTPGEFNGDYFQTSGTVDGFAISNGPCGAIANGGSLVDY